MLNVKSACSFQQLCNGSATCCSMSLATLPQLTKIATMNCTGLLDLQFWIFVGWVFAAGVALGGIVVGVVLGCCLAKARQPKSRRSSKKKDDVLNVSIGHASRTKGNQSWTRKAAHPHSGPMNQRVIES